MDLLNRRIRPFIQRAALFVLFFLGINASSSASTTFIYYVVDPNAADNPLTLSSQPDGNSITAGANLYALNNNETIIVAAVDILQGDVISGSAEFSIGSYSDSGKSVPQSLLGTSFVMPHVGGSPQRHYIFYDVAMTTLNATVNWWGSADSTVVVDTIHNSVDDPVDSSTDDVSRFLTAAP